MSVEYGDPGQRARPAARRIIRAVALPAAPRIPKRARDGIGGHADRCYCACGAKKTNGVCPRCAA